MLVLLTAVTKTIIYVAFDMCFAFLQLWKKYVDHLIYSQHL